MVFAGVVVAADRIKLCLSLFAISFSRCNIGGYAGNG